MRFALLFSSEIIREEYSSLKSIMQEVSLCGEHSLVWLNNQSNLILKTTKNPSRTATVLAEHP